MSDTTQIAALTEDQLKRLEDKVRRGAAAFIETGQALAKIREGKGYRLRGYDTFEAYCQKEFGITDRHGRRLIQSAETATEVKKLTGSAPASEFVSREFAPLVDDPEKLKKVVEQIEKKGYSVVTATAETVKEAVQRLAPKPKPAPASGNGKTVVLPGNGHGLGAQAVARTLAAAPAKLDAPTGECPWCHERPAKYEQSEETWECGNCGGVVMLSVIKWPPEDAPQTKTCAGCKKSVTSTHRYCDYCGSIL